MELCQPHVVQEVAGCPACDANNLREMMADAVNAHGFLHNAISNARTVLVAKATEARAIAASTADRTQKIIQLGRAEAYEMACALITTN